MDIIAWYNYNERRANRGRFSRGLVFFFDSVASKCQEFLSLQCTETARSHPRGTTVFRTNSIATFLTSSSKLSPNLPSLSLFLSLLLLLRYKKHTSRLSLASEKKKSKRKTRARGRPFNALSLARSALTERKTFDSEKTRLFFVITFQSEAD
jgi:hypothetical protein